MNHVTKRPPPDSVGNVRGRMAELHKQAHALAMGGVRIEHVDEKGKRASPMEPREVPKDYAKLLAAVLKEFAPQFKKLERRLKKCPKEVTVTREARDARKAAERADAKQTKKKVAKKADTRERATAKMNGEKKNIAASVLDGGDSQEPLSREGALTEGVSQDHTPESDSDLLNFMQSTLDQ